MDSSIWNEYDKITTLGTSLFGTVYKGRRKKDNKIVSIKEYNRYQEGAIETYEKDVKYMEELKSDYTIKKIDVKQTNDYSYIIREYCYGSLEEFIKSHDDGMKPFEIQKILNQLIEPFKKLNEKKLIHKDIKPSNILFSFKGLNDFKAKLSGIYFCSKLGEEDNGMKGMRYITPPEGLKGETINMKYDIWSVGVLIYFMIKGKYPFEGRRDLIVLNAIENGIKLNNLSGDNDLDELIEKCLEVDVKKRISWEDFFKDKFLTKKFPKKEKKKDNKPLSVEDKQKLEYMKNLKNKFPINKNRDIIRNFLGNPDGYVRLANQSMSENDEVLKNLNILLEKCKEYSKEFIAILKEDIQKE